MKQLLWFIFCMVLVQGAVAQSGTIAGTISYEGKPVSYATVRLGKSHVVSDSMGRFSVVGSAAGKQLLRVSAAGYTNFDSMIVLRNAPIDLQIHLQADAGTIDEVVVSGTMKAVSKMSSPIPVEVYSPAFFRKNPSPAIFESLQMINGIQPQLNCNVCNTGDIHINGMEGPYTMILIDGMPIVSSLSTVYGLSGIPNSMVKRIEVVKGPASTLYGSEAVGGLINIITKDAVSAERWKLDFSGTHMGELNADIATSHAFKKAATLVGINYFNYNQRRDINNDRFTDITLQNRLSVFNKWNVQLSDNRQASLALRYITEDRWGGEVNWQPQFKGGDSIYGESIRTNRAEVISTINIGRHSTVDLSYNYHLQDSYYGTVKYYASQQVAFAQWRFNKKLGAHDLLAGVPLRYTFYDDNTPGTALPTGTNQPSRTFLPGIFVQDEWKLHQQLTLLAGLRYDYHQQHGSIVTPRLSFKYAPNLHNTFRFSAGNGYRVVNLFTEDHAALTGARDVVIASALKPEQSWNGNLNYTAFIRHSKGFINLDASIFYTYFTNKIVGDYFIDPTKIIYDNLNGYAVSKGITVNVDANFTNGIKFNAGVTLMDVYQVQNNMGKDSTIPQLFAPRLSGTFALSYTLPRQKIAIDLTGRITGPMQLPVVPNDFRREQSPTFGIINLQVSKPFSNGIELYAGVKNLLHFIPAHPILHPDDPFNKPGGKYFDANGNARPDTNPNGYSFDPSYNYAPVQGAKCYAGIRYQLR